MRGEGREVSKLTQQILSILPQVCASGDQRLTLLCLGEKINIVGKHFIRDVVLVCGDGPLMAKADHRDARTKSLTEISRIDEARCGCILPG